MAFGGTEILARLSTGGMGEVLLGRRHGALGFEKLCAIKTIRGDLVSRSDFRAMFLDEAKLVARLDHPTICQVYDFGEEGKTLFLAMEYVAGVPLSQLLKAGRAPFPPVVAARIVAEVCRGLHYAHTATDPAGQPLGVVHRDVSPQNLILTFEGRVKILDFGIAITKDREAPETAVGVLKGKPSYMAPEHLRGSPVDRRADVFSSSVVLHELLTGRKLFTRETALATALAVEGDPIEPPSATLPDLDPVLDALVMKGLSRSPDDRFPDARSMGDALDRVAATMGAMTLEDYAKTELAEESEAHQKWLIDVLDRAERHAEERKAPVEPLNFEDTSLPGPPPEAKPPPESKPVPWNSIAPPPPARTSGSPPGRSSGPPPVRTSMPSEDTTYAGEPRRKSPAFLLAVIPLLLLLAVVFWPRAKEAPPVEPVPTSTPAEVAKAPEKTAEPEPTPVVVDVVPSPTPSPTAHAVDPPPTHERRPPRTPQPTPSPTKRPREKPEDEVSGYGFVTIGAQPYALVRIDGAEAGVTPLLKRRLSAGSHEIELVSPDNGEVRLKKRVKLEADEHQRITIP